MSACRVLRKRAVEEPKAQITLRKLVPVRPKDSQHLQELHEDLTRIGCGHFLELPWNFRDEAMIREVLEGAKNQWTDTLRCNPDLWTESAWREVYRFRAGGMGMASRRDEYARGKFAHTVDPKDGYPISDCLDERERRVLEFLIPICYPEKPSRVTVTLGNTIFGALSGERLVDWGRIIREVVMKLVAGVGRTKGSALSPFLYHLYHHNHLLTDREENDWGTQEALLTYGASGSESGPQTDSESSKDEGGKRNEPSPKAPRPRTKVKSTPRDGRGQPSGSGSRIPTEDPFRSLLENLEDLRNRHYEQEEAIRKIAGLVGEADIYKLPGAVAHAIADPDEVRRMHEVNERLRKENSELREEGKGIRVELAKKGEELKAAQDRVLDAVRGLDRIRKVSDFPGDVLNKAKLYDKDKGAVSGARIIKILVDFGGKVETSLKEIRALV